MVFMLLIFVLNYTATTEIYTYCHTLSLHDALPISVGNLEYQCVTSIVDAHTQANRAVRGELDGIAQQIEQDLPQSQRITNDMRRQPLAAVHLKADALDRKSTRLNSSH